jgi:ribosome-binding factor A
MTNRVARVRELMKHELASLLARDFDFEGALVTINDVDLTPDLRQAHIYVGLMGREDLTEAAFQKIKKSTYAISQKLCKRVILRNTPHLHFKIDNSVERGVRIVKLLEEVDAMTPLDASAPVDEYPPAEPRLSHLDRRTH